MFCIVSRKESKKGDIHSPTYQEEISYCQCFGEICRIAGRVVDFFALFFCLAWSESSSVKHIEKTVRKAHKEDGKNQKEPFDPSCDIENDVDSYS